MPTLTQLAPLLRLFAPAAITLLTSYVGADLATQLVAFALSLAGAGTLSLYANTQGSLAQTVAAMPGVKVAVSPAAAPELLKLASDPTVPDVVHAEDSYSTSAPNPYSTQRRKS